MKKKWLAAMAVGLGLLCGVSTMQVRAEEVPPESIMVETPESLSEGDVSGNSILSVETTILTKERDGFSVPDVRGGNAVTFDPTDGRYKILIFGSFPTCDYSTGTVKKMDAIYQYLDPAKVQICGIDIRFNSESAMVEKLNSDGISRDINMFARDSDPAAHRVHVDCFYEGLDEGVVDADSYSYYMPLVAYVDGNGKVLKVTTGPKSMSELLTTIVDCGMKLNDTPRNGVSNATIESMAKHVKVQNYIKRLYNLTLEREAEAGGLNDWVNKLETGKETGASAAYGFFFSKEYINRHVSNEEFVETMYMVMMDRPGEMTGVNNWVKLLNEGVSREFVFKGFSDSIEFTNICKNYGINRGTITLSEPKDQNEGVTRFVVRLYRNALGRDCDKNGLNTWCNVICNKTQTVEDVSTNGFFHSREFINKHTTDEEYVKILYRTFLGREADETGLKDWLAHLKNGMTRDQVLYGFSQSKEFKNIMAKYGL